MDSLEITKPSPAPPTPTPEEVPSTTMMSCCAPGSSARSPGGAVLIWLHDWRVLAASGLALGGTGLAFGWDWLTAIGVAPLIVSAAPCLVMCALGLCMMGRGRQPSSSQPDARVGEPTTRTEPPASP
jgi:hypothetical protein